MVRMFSASEDWNEKTWEKMERSKKLALEAALIERDEREETRLALEALVESVRSKLR